MAKSIDLLIILFGSFICLHTGNNGLYVNPLPNTAALQEADQTARQRIKSIYTKEIGVREETDKNDGKRVAEYLKYTGLPESYAWCAAFISWCFKEANYNEPRTAWSPSLFPSKRVIWKRNGGVVVRNGKSKLPKKGDVFGIYFTNLKRIAHAGFVDEWSDKYLISVEGNTNEGESRDGDGVYRKRRPISSIYQVSNWID